MILEKIVPYFDAFTNVKVVNAIATQLAKTQDDLLVQVLRDYVQVSYHHNDASGKSFIEINLKGEPVAEVEYGMVDNVFRITSRRLDK
jgi:hypothetical protein